MKPDTKVTSSKSSVKKTASNVVSPVSQRNGKQTLGSPKVSPLPNVKYQPQNNPADTIKLVCMVGVVIACGVALLGTIMYFTKGTDREAHCLEFIKQVAKKLFNSMKQGTSANIKIKDAVLTGLSIDMFEIKSISPYWNNSGLLYFSIFYPIVYFNTSVNATGMGIRSSWLQSHSHNVTFAIVLGLTPSQEEFELKSVQMFAKIDHPKPDSVGNNEDKIDPESSKFYEELTKDVEALKQLRDLLEHDIFRKTVGSHSPKELSDLSCFR